MAEYYGGEVGHKEECTCGKCTGEDAALETFNDGLMSFRTERIISSKGRCNRCGADGSRGKDLIKQYENEEIFWLCTKCSIGAVKSASNV